MVNNNFKVDERLTRDCIQLGIIQGQHLLLMNNADYPWFILVPETDKTELYQLSADEQQITLSNINKLSEHLLKHYPASKINTAAIGNIVRQLHIHIIGRHENDPCWPGVVWGSKVTKCYSEEDIAGIKNLLLTDKRLELGKN